MKNYVSPKITFENIELTEKIANRCWAEGTPGGDKSVWYHNNGINVEMILSGGACQKNDLSYVMINNVKYGPNTKEYNSYNAIFENASNHGNNTDVSGFRDNRS